MSTETKSSRKNANKNKGPSYQITAKYKNIQHVGKTFRSTKKKITWAFGNYDKTHVVELYDSLTSGKKRLVVDAKTVFQTKLTDVEFSHVIAINGIDVRITKKRCVIGPDQYIMKINNQLFSTLRRSSAFEVGSPPPKGPGVKIGNATDHEPRQNLEIQPPVDDVVEKIPVKEEHVIQLEEKEEHSDLLDLSIESKKDRAESTNPFDVFSDPFFTETNPKNNTISKSTIDSVPINNQFPLVQNNGIHQQKSTNPFEQQGTNNSPHYQPMTHSVKPPQQIHAVNNTTVNGYAQQQQMHNGYSITNNQLYGGTQGNNMYQMSNQPYVYAPNNGISSTNAMIPKHQNIVHHNQTNNTQFDILNQNPF